jgi:hypothetical protein
MRTTTTTTAFCFRRGVGRAPLGALEPGARPQGVEAAAVRAPLLCISLLHQKKATASIGRLPAAFAWPHPRGPTTQTPRPVASSLAQRTPARSTGGDHPSGTDMEHVAAARTTGCYRKSVPGATKHTGCSRAHTHEHQSQWREAQGAGRRARDGGWVGAKPAVEQHKGRAAAIFRWNSLNIGVLYGMCWACIS